MTFCEELILNIIFLLFPFFFYIIFIAHNNNYKKKNCMFLLDMTNLAVIYLLTTYGKYFKVTTFLLLINIPLIISFYKKRAIASILIAIIIVIFQHYNYNLPIVLVSIEYIFYLILFLLLNKEYKSFDCILNIFAFIKGIILSFEIIYLIPNTTKIPIIIAEILLMLIIFYFITILVVKLISIGENTVSFNSVLKDLEKEKEIKNSLFKITHEIKNPIAVCTGYLSMMDYKDINKVKKYNHIIKSELNRTLDIMDDFSDYSKININPEIMDLNILIEETLYSMKPIFKKKQIKLKYNEEDKELLINGDFNRLKQVLINVLKNSVEAITKDGIIEIIAKEKNNKDIQIIIRDNGCGMNEKVMNKLGELFYTTKRNGTGLGVSLSKEIIKLHDGKIEYSSKENKGTEVTITIPKYKEFT